MAEGVPLSYCKELCRQLGHEKCSGFVYTRNCDNPSNANKFNKCTCRARRGDISEGDCNTSGDDWSTSVKMTPTEQESDSTGVVVAAAATTACPVHGAVHCVACNHGYALSANNTCEMIPPPVCTCSGGTAARVDTIP